MGRHIPTSAVPGGTSWSPGGLPDLPHSPSAQDLLPGRAMNASRSSERSSGCPPPASPRGDGRSGGGDGGRGGDDAGCRRGRAAAWLRPATSTRSEARSSGPEPRMNPAADCGSGCPSVRSSHGPPFPPSPCRATRGELGLPIGRVARPTTRRSSCSNSSWLTAAVALVPASGGLVDPAGSRGGRRAAALVGPPLRGGRLAHVPVGLGALLGGQVRPRADVREDEEKHGPPPSGCLGPRWRSAGGRPTPRPDDAGQPVPPGR
jgi:hypothetical protein